MGSSVYKVQKQHPQLFVILLIVCLMAATGGMAQPAWASMHQVTWTTQADFENNASTTGTKTTRVGVDTTTVPGDVMIGLTKDLLSSSSISYTTLGKIYTIGADRQSVAVINADTKALVGNIALPARPSGIGV